MSQHLEELRRALQDYVPNDGDDLGVLTGYYVIAQWSDGEGTEWLTRTAGNINDDGPSVWTCKGWLQQALDKVDEDADEGDE